VLVGAVTIAVTACAGASSKTAATTVAKAAAAAPLPVSPGDFGKYGAVPLQDPNTPAYQGPATPHSVAKIVLTKGERAELKQVKALGPALAKNSFAVVRSGSGLFADEYEGNIYGGFPIYVTTDAAYNAWHLVFDKTLRDLESGVLSPKLSLLLTRALANAHKETLAAAGTPLGVPASHVEQLYELAESELGMSVKLGPLATREKALIAAHDAKSTSPITGAQIDYSLFTPRGHYTLTPALTRFFLSMSVLGQLAFCLPGTAACPGTAPMREGILAANDIATDAKAEGLWQSIYAPTAFLVGLADDYTPAEVVAALGSTGKSVRSLGTDSAVAKVAAALVAKRKLKIDPQSASIRIMGTRFVLDDYLLDQLIYPNVGTSAKPRVLPSGLDVAAALGSKAAVRANPTATAYKGYSARLAKLQAAVAARPRADWGSTVYDAWLYALQPMFAPHGNAFPDYMRSPAWADKDLQTGLGSYTELKHDTVLFTKQPAAEAGGDPVQKTPLNWVEPDPVAFERLAAASTLMRQGLASRGLLTKEAGGLLDTDTALFDFFARVAKRELAGKPLPAADNTRLRGIGDTLASIWFRTAQRNEAASLPDQAALVADVASSPTQVLEDADGEIDTLYVIVPDGHGHFELARGGVYSYYEFAEPSSERLTDSDWRAMLVSGKVPPRPAWESSFRVLCPPPPKALAKYNPGCSSSDMPG
jgi:hypothetical protein